MPPRVVFFVPELPVSSRGVLHAQVLTPARMLARHGYDCLFIGSDECGGNAEDVVRDIQDRYEIDAMIYDGYSSRYRFLSIGAVIAKVARLARERIRKHESTHIYVRSFTSAKAVRKLGRDRGISVVYDVRAARAEEIALSRGYGLRYGVVKKLDATQIRGADRVMCVSNRLKAWIRDEVGRDDAVVIPCCIDGEEFKFDPQARARIRGECAFDDQQKVVCYCGGLSVWQRISDVLALLDKLAMARQHYRFLFLTPDPTPLSRMLEDAGPPPDRCVVRSCPHHEVPAYLSAADAGIIMRHDIVVNNVASPVKIAEYLGCGAPVILTNGIGDLTELVRSENVGLVLDERKDLGPQVTTFLDRPDFPQFRERAIRVCQEHLTFEAHLSRYRACFAER